MNRNFTAMLAIVFTLGACGPGNGACITSDGANDYCFDTTNPDQCRDETLYELRAGATCEDEGFTVECNGELYPEAYVCPEE